MDRKKIMYIGIIFIITVISSITYFSYGFLTSKNEYHGRVNMIVGTLDYKIKSADLDNNNSITLQANESKKIDIEITSLNEIESKYELYYETESNDIEVGYSSSTIDNVSGTIPSNGTKKVTAVLKNKSASNVVVTFGIQGGFTYNNITLEEGRIAIDEELNLCAYNPGQVFEFSFDPDGDGKGQEQSFIVPCDGNYKLETWGAQGGFQQSDVALSNFTGYGGYAYGTYVASENETLYINVGEMGKCGYSSTPYLLNGGYNGGGSSFAGSSAGNIGCSGGGATHIAKESGLLYQLETKKDSIIMVAGGGGGIGPDDDRSGAGGGTYGGNGTGTAICNGHGATQTGLRNDSNCSTAGLLCFGRGNSSSLLGGAGGGGYYGGDNGASDNTNAYVAINHSCSPFSSHDSHGTNIWSAGGGGGSGYLKNTLTSSGFYCYTGCGGDNTTVVINFGSHIEKYANSGNGYVRITYLGE